MRPTDQIDDPTWADIWDRDAIIKLQEVENRRLTAELEEYEESDWRHVQEYNELLKRFNDAMCE